MEKAISFNKVSFAYEAQWVLRDVSFDLAKNGFLGIIGPNGGGKTTILRLILGFLSPQQGKIHVMGKAPGKKNLSVGYVPQNIDFDPKFPISVNRVAAMGLVRPGSFFPWESADNDLKVAEALKKVGIQHLGKRLFGELSWGQKQRTMIARALVSDPKVLILDEPTASIDSEAEKDIYENLHQLNREMAIIIVSHDLGFVSHYVKEILCVNVEAICDTVDAVNFDTIRKIYRSNMHMIKHDCHL